MIPPESLSAHQLAEIVAATLARWRIEVPTHARTSAHANVIIGLAVQCLAIERLRRLRAMYVRHELCPGPFGMLHTEYALRRRQRRADDLRRALRA